ncbi:hypothetical protein BJV82DRAFT_616903 [Fennellomyces sp. T-0311]|nr:hypothetical protein BJV82DRAFT_616903 [Fennellomyces sp. T-0311]
MRSIESLSIKDAAGRQISLLNDQPPPQKPVGRRRYHCTEPGCNKSFTTSGHLARHNRIHTGEKNFHCLYPGCPSRFSRQDNMMQHYRTHMSPKSRRHHQQSKQQHPPRLHCHAHICSDSATLHPLMRPAFADPYPRPYYYHPSPLQQQQQQQHVILPKPRPMEPTVRRPRRASSTSSCSSTNSSFASPPPQTTTLLPPIQSSDEKSNTGLLQLAHIVSTFG